MYYIENNKLAILKDSVITIEDLVEYAYRDKPGYNLRTSLLNYIKARKEKFINFDEDYKSNTDSVPSNIKEMMVEVKEDTANVVSPEPQPAPKIADAEYPWMNYFGEEARIRVNNPSRRSRGLQIDSEGNIVSNF